MIKLSELTNVRTFFHFQSNVNLMKNLRCERNAQVLEMSILVVHRNLHLTTDHRRQILPTERFCPSSFSKTKPSARKSHFQMSPRLFLRYPRPAERRRQSSVFQNVPWMSWRGIQLSLTPKHPPSTSPLPFLKLLQTEIWKTLTICPNLCRLPVSKFLKTRTAAAKVCQRRFYLLKRAS